MSVKKKKKSSVNFLVRAEFLTERPPAQPPARTLDRPPLLITKPHSPPARPPASGDHYTPQP